MKLVAQSRISDELEKDFAINRLGGLIVNYTNSFATARLFVPIIVIAVLGVGLTEIVLFIEQIGAKIGESVFSRCCRAGARCPLARPMVLGH